MSKRNPAREIGRRLAGPDHAVVTVAGGDDGGFSHMTKVCSQCPWRLDATVGEFPADAYRHSANTAYDMSAHVFACHMSGLKLAKTCAGFLLRGADNNMAVRFAIIQGRYDPASVSSDVELYDSYRDMAEANGVDEDDRALRPCR